MKIIAGQKYRVIESSVLPDGCRCDFCNAIRKNGNLVVAKYSSTDESAYVTICAAGTPHTLTTCKDFLLPVRQWKKL